MSKNLPDFRFSRLLSRICLERLTRNERRKTRPTFAGSIDFRSFDRKKFFISVRFIIELLFDYRFGFLHARAFLKSVASSCLFHVRPQTGLKIFTFSCLLFFLHNFKIYTAPYVSPWSLCRCLFAIRLAFRIFFLCYFAQMCVCSSTFSVLSDKCSWKYV